MAERRSSHSIIHRLLSRAAGFAVARARRRNAVLLTTDHHELDLLLGAGLCPIQFIR